VTEGRRTQWSWLGRVGYRDAFELQVRARAALAAGTGPERLLLLEHPHVYTLGRNADPSDVLFSTAELESKGVELVETDRGGQVTYHGPGQLVGYPILDLNPDRRDLRRYVRDLQQVLVRVLAAYGVRAAGGEGDRIGVWVEDPKGLRPEDASGSVSNEVSARKIASLGVHVARWRTTHGFALNVETDLALFGGIVACGLPAVEMTSLAREIRAPVPPLEELAARLVPEFADVFGRTLVRADPPLAA
jgi:lipoyl(octanoyl) transferase